LNINVGVLNIGNDPESQHSCGFQGFLRDDYLNLGRSSVFRTLGQIRVRINREACQKGHSMMKKNTAPLVERVACKMCMKEIPKSEANIAEATDYVAHFCGVACYDKWRKQPGALPLPDGSPSDTMTS
jgi:hypothetical protein